MTIEDQRAVLTFLTDPASYGDPSLSIHTSKTHISVIVFVGSRVFKLKRAVRLPYVDFSTVERRLQACYQELTLNRRTAPTLYVAVRHITGEADGRLMLDGEGELLDAVVEMIRFDEDTLFDRQAERGQLTPASLTLLAHIIADFHAQAPIYRQDRGAERLAAVLRINEQSLANSPVLTSEIITPLTTALWQTFDEHAALLNARERAGKVRRCHGDLHLRNICSMQGVPTLFDCIEFDEELATIDVLYDLAFLLMDLWHRGLKSEANLVFNRYLDECDEVDGLALLPFFMSVRATIRAHVTAEQALQTSGSQYEELVEKAKSYASLALGLLSLSPARLVAIGGLSGTGKSTVAAALAHRIGPAPGARVLASDRIRKQLYGVSAQTRLPEQAYRSEVSGRVYTSLVQSATAVLSVGYGVVADAVFDRPAGRELIEQAALEAGVVFTGFWLYAKPELLFSRVDQRVGGPSDATVDVVRKQLAGQTGLPDWFPIDAGQTVMMTLAQITRVLAD